MVEPASLPVRFFDELRAVLLDDKQLLDVDVSTLPAIAADPELSRQFTELFARNGQNPEVSEIVIDALKRLIAFDESAFGRSQEHMGTIDRYAGRLGLSALIGGVGALVLGSAEAGSQGGIVLAAIGTAMMVTSAAVRTILSRKAHRSIESQRHIEALLSRLERRIERTTDA